MSAFVSRLIITVATVVALGLILGAYHINDTFVHTRTITTCSAEKGLGVGNDQHYYVTTTEGGVYMVPGANGIDARDPASFKLIGKIDLRVPGTYVIRFNHHRWQPFKWFPQILSAKQLATDEVEAARCPA